MPIYEFYCPDNNKLYSFLARSLAYRQHTPRCPDNPAFLLQRRVSNFAIVGKAKDDSADDPFSQLDDTKLEALMADMEREMGSMDESNPDPKQLGRFMRKMTDLMGDKAPEAIREMVSRLEAGEDPDKLEEQYGHLAAHDPEAAGEHAAADALWDTVRKKLRHLRTSPIRDPKLYELTDYL
ncbi:MAG: cytochrome C [Verrucomicrobiaceae bacterium]|nr:cytochrome C [Verrucomicrobiaceae bacterium]